jgi:hypothetical protein
VQKVEITMSQESRDLFAALSDAPQPGSRTIDRAVSRWEQAAAMMLSHGYDPASHVLNAIEADVPRLSNIGLQRLEVGLEALAVRSQSLSSALSEVRSRVKVEAALRRDAIAVCGTPAWHAVTQTVIELVPHVRCAVAADAHGDVNDCFCAMAGVARDRLERLGIHPAPETVHALIKEALGRLVADNILTEEELRHALAQLPATSLQLLASAPVFLDGAHHVAPDVALRSAIDQIWNSAKEGFAEALSTLRTVPLRTSLSALTALSRHYQTVRRLDGIHAHVAAPFIETLRTLDSDLAEAIAAGRIVPITMSNEGLGALSKALEDLELAPNHGVLTEIQTRKEQARADYVDAIMKVIQCSAAEDWAGFLAALQTASDVLDAALVAHAKLGEDVIGGDDVMNLRATLMDEAIARQGEGGVLRLFAMLNHRKGLAYREVLASAGHQLMASHRVDGAWEKKGLGMYRLSIDVACLELAVQNAMRARIEGLELAPLLRMESGIGDLRGEELAILEEAFGIAFLNGTPVLRHPASQAFHAQFERSLQEMGASGASVRMMDAHRKKPDYISSNFWLDLPRADYVILGWGNTGTALLDRGAWAKASESEQAALQEGAVRSLETLCGSAPLAGRVSHFLHQGIFAGLYTHSRLSPIEHHNQSGVLIADANRTGAVRYVLRRAERGGVAASLSYYIPSARFFQTAEGRLIDLDQARSAAVYTFDVRICPDGIIELTRPVEVAYRIVEGDVT